MERDDEKSNTTAHFAVNAGMWGKKRLQFSQYENCKTHASCDKTHNIYVGL